MGRQRRREVESQGEREAQGIVEFDPFYYLNRYVTLCPLI